MSREEVVVAELVPQRVMSIEVAGPNVAQRLYRSRCCCRTPHVGAYRIERLIVVAVIVHVDYSDGAKIRPEDFHSGYVGRLDGYQIPCGRRDSCVDHNHRTGSTLILGVRWWVD
jgi:hypothetical protein